ncbi:MAG: hypothetical protein AAF610_04330 [Pseudomonadota bacterium]
MIQRYWLLSVVGVVLGGCGNAEPVVEQRSDNPCGTYFVDHFKVVYKEKASKNRVWPSDNQSACIKESDFVAVGTSDEMVAVVPAKISPLGKGAPDPKFFDFCEVGKKPQYGCGGVSFTSANGFSNEKKGRNAIPLEVSTKTPPAGSEDTIIGRSVCFSVGFGSQNTIDPRAVIIEDRVYAKKKRQTLRRASEIYDVLSLRDPNKNEQMYADPDYQLWEAAHGIAPSVRENAFANRSEFFDFYSAFPGYIESYHDMTLAQAEACMASDGEDLEPCMVRASVATGALTPATRCAN